MLWKIWKLRNYRMSGNYRISLVLFLLMAATMTQMSIESANIQQGLFLWAQGFLCWLWVVFAKPAQVKWCCASSKTNEIRSAPEMVTKLLDIRGALGKRDRGQELKMSMQNHSGKRRFKYFWAGWMFLFASAPWCLNCLCSQGKCGVIAAP